MRFKKNILNFIESNDIFKKNISRLDLENINNLKEFNFYDLLDGEYLANILVQRKHNFDDTQVQYLHLSECIENLKLNMDVKMKWIPIKFGIFYIVFIVDEEQNVFDFFGFRPKI